MKKTLTILSLLILFISCEKPSDCVETTGNIISKQVDITTFTRLEVYTGIEVIITQGTQYKLQIQTGENLMSNIEVTQEGTVLKLKDNTTCNWVREYGQTKIYITTPKIDEIYSKTDRNISSNGVITFDLKVIAFDKNADGSEGAGTGDFYFTVNNNIVDIEHTNVSRFYLSGNTTTLLANFYAGDGRIEAQDLIAQNVSVYHRGSNDMIVKPIQSITGKMVSTGNVILKNNPPIVAVEQLYQGHIIYN
jgi:hypothetical protein